ncbi:MAG: polysaccharide deacetylase family protein [Paludibacteraceae bacterium]|nr:polysaccharide deacetylase family protein [Paludibacteraceae bacterium]
MSPVEYILSFMLDFGKPGSLVGYTADKSEWKNYKVVIIPSNFFKDGVYGTAASMPKLPLKQVEGVPFLFGEDSVSRTNSQVFVKADLVASAYFLLSRYEELIVKERDEHGRFAAKSSLLFKAGILGTPVVEMYGRLLRKWLGECGVKIPALKSGYKFVMTHDVDAIAQYRSLRGLAGGLLRNKALTALKSFIGGVENDPLFTFDWMKNQEKQLNSITVKTFIKVAGKTLTQDIPYFNPYSDDVKKVLKLYPDAGLHVSYEAALNPQLIKGELEILESVTDRKVTCSRHHYLASLKPCDMRFLIDAGITDDYTMGFADCAGFRLGTCRPVRWIDPERKEVTTLTLHPLVVMDCTLSSDKYMELNMDEAFDLYKKLRMESMKHGGEFVTLWHNTSVAQTDGSYHRELFEKILNYEEPADSL